jgi:hypothetical protein
LKPLEEEAGGRCLDDLLEPVEQDLAAWITGDNTSSERLARLQMKRLKVESSVSSDVWRKATETDKLPLRRWR